MKVINRSDSNVVYSLPEFNCRRVFAPGETKEVTAEELEALYATDGGADLLRQYLLVDDRFWVQNHFEAPIEYFWKEPDIIKCLEEDPLDLFEETFDFAPDGVVDLIKSFAWQRPLTDLNKVKILEEKTGFDVITSINIMHEPQTQEVPAVAARRRREA